MASCDVKFLVCNPPLTETKCACGIQVGAGMTFGLAGTTFGLAVHGDRCRAIIRVGGGLEIRQCGAVGMILGTLPGMLFCVCCECILLLDFKVRV